jgi:hypothetical protein
VTRESGSAHYFIEVAGAVVSTVKARQYTFTGPRLAFRNPVLAQHRPQPPRQRYPPNATALGGPLSLSSRDGPLDDKAPCRIIQSRAPRDVTPAQTRYLAEPKPSVEHQHVCHMAYPVLDPHLAVAADSFPEIP